MLTCAIFCIFLVFFASSLTVFRQKLESVYFGGISGHYNVLGSLFVIVSPWWSYQLFNYATLEMKI